MRKVIKMEPSSAFTDAGFNKGDVFSVGSDPNRYLYLSIDPWYVYCIRWYWYDRYLGIWHAWRHKDKNAKNKD